MDRYVFLHQKIKELDPLSSMATQPTHPSLIKVLFYLSFKSGMNSIGWHSVLTYLQSPPIALILQAARLWYYDYYISFSFFSLVQALWFHLKVHWHGLSEEFHLSTLIIHTHYCISAQERLSHELQLIHFQSSAVTWCNTAKFWWWPQTFNSGIHAVDTAYTLHWSLITYEREGHKNMAII